MSGLDAGTALTDTISIALPLPYRLTTLFTLGVFLWAVTVHNLARFGINVATLLQYDPLPGPAYQNIYLHSLALFQPQLTSYVAYCFLTHFWDRDLLRYFTWLPDLMLVFIVVLSWMVPSFLLHARVVWPASGRNSLLSTFGRIILGGLRTAKNERFGDILMADVLTSCARPLSEVYIAVYLGVVRKSAVTALDRKSFALVPVILAIPFVIRMRQCYLHDQPANLIKYLTAIPPIVLSVLVSFDIGRPVTTGFWFLSSLLNTAYSFFWDVTKDWDLTLLTTKRYSSDYPFGLRRTRKFNNKWYYYGMIAVDLVLRLSWAFRFVPGLKSFFAVEGGMFLQEVLEVVRRALWANFRIEAEWIRGEENNSIPMERVRTERLSA
ncbi:protein-ER retention protein [Elasticomyces elasticus]|nr:protein-ER retention protein [Elasticomyces elasticus]KAK3660945.1 protein-ER retention protein [Elasticomyces elasticus]KAK4932351.1 protein-ER retention protein [Elasticomyces elasticus]KAK5768359.1 protein-ER retention protein [Elasticomyces elasticus]